MSSVPPSPDEPNDPDAPGTDEPGTREDDAEAMLLTAPRGGVPAVIETRAALQELLDRVAAGQGPLAVDAERAHGFRYSQRAYLIQVRRAGVGTALIDPVALAEEAADEPAAGPNGSRVDGAERGARRRRPRGGSAERQSGLPGTPADLSALGRSVGEQEWVVHAASQDLPCLVEVGLVPQRLFDTELAGRLLGYPRVNLGTLLEELLGFRLLKEHSASDWSIRPLPAAWLNYAALDVELLIELRDVLAAQLEAEGKAEWARQEFSWLVEHAGEPREPRVDPWRRTSGIHRIRDQRGLAIVSELWQARDVIARRTDRAPGKVLPDSAIVEIAAHRAPSVSTMLAMPAYGKRQHRRYQTNWTRALEAALAMPNGELPPMHRPSDGPPQSRLWSSRDPVAAARLQRVRRPLIAVAERLQLPLENLLTPDFLRRIAWTPPEVIDRDHVDAYLAGLGARPWQRDIVVGPIVEHLPEPAAN